MNDQIPPEPPASAEQVDLAAKIERLIRERGWNQEDLARNAGLNRQTIRQILRPTAERKLRNATVSACAVALGLTVGELCDFPVEQLLPRMHTRRPGGKEVSLQRLYEEATQPELLAWAERNPERARELSDAEIDELLSIQGTGGPLSSLGVEHYVQLLERKRKLIHQVHAIAGTEYLGLLEQFVTVLFEKVQPYADRK
jgi:transcriptional regulator with XRE-family HTH domain